MKEMIVNFKFFSEIFPIFLEVFQNLVFKFKLKKFSKTQIQMFDPIGHESWFICASGCTLNASGCIRASDSLCSAINVDFGEQCINTIDLKNWIIKLNIQTTDIKNELYKVFRHVYYSRKGFWTTILQDVRKLKKRKPMRKTKPER